jgi:hypothetical protein
MQSSCSSSSQAPTYEKKFDGPSLGAHAATDSELTGNTIETRARRNPTNERESFIVKTLSAYINLMESRN